MINVMKLGDKTIGECGKDLTVISIKMQRA